MNLDDTACHFFLKFFKNVICVSIRYKYAGTQRGQKTRIPWSWS